MTDLAMPVRHFRLCTGELHKALGEPTCSSAATDVAGIGIWATQEPGEEVQIVIDAPAGARLTLEQGIELKYELAVLIDDIQGTEPVHYVVAPRAKS